MTTVLYRVNGGEVVKISPTNQTFDQRELAYWAVATDPNFLDGTDLREDLGGGNLGPLRQLGYAKTIDGADCRNATQPEIDNFVVAEDSDEAIMDREGAKDLFDSHPRMRKLMIAFADIIKDEINILRDQHGLADRTLAQLKTAINNRISEQD
jgi:hypothetical protein